MKRTDRILILGSSIIHHQKEELQSNKNIIQQKNYITEEIRPNLRYQKFASVSDAEYKAPIFI